MSTAIVPFIERVQSNAMHNDYYERIKACLLGYKGVKNRSSIRCDSYRYKGKLIAKIAVGGHTLKLYLDAEVPAEMKVSKVSKEGVSAYKEVPLMLPLKSDVAVRKAQAVIANMMEAKGIEKA